MRDLRGKTAFVTGGASGIGFGMAQAFLAEGMNVVIADVRDDHLAAARATLGERADTEFLTLDVTDRAAMAAAAEAVVARFGKVHILCNNAGVGQLSGAFNTTYDDWDWSIGVNLNGVFNGIHAFLPLIAAHGEGGHIVNTASTAAALPGGFTYAATKSAVLGLTESMAAELAERGIGATCLMPGPVRTNIHEVARLRPERFSRTNSTAFEAELAERVSPDHWMEPIVVGRMVVDAIRRDLLFVFTHKEFREGIARRFEAMLAAVPHGSSTEAEKERIGFPVRNPIYDRLVAEAPASGAERID
jgi:NAD(P)-dependent dehydrogenase (short-subunit alcohol dehydrogenase family)